MCVKKLIASVLLAAALPAYASGANFDGQVQAVVLDKVRIAAVDAMPDWMQVGQEVNAFGWPAKVHEVAAGEVTLKLSLNRLKNVKQGDAVSIRAPAPTELDPAACGV